MLIRFRRTTKRNIIAAAAAFILLIGISIAAYLVVSSQAHSKYEQELKNLQDKLEIGSREVYEATRDIMRGEILDTDNLKRSNVQNSMPNDCFFTQQQIGNVAIMDINQGTHLLKSMAVTPLKNDSVREFETSVVKLNNNLEAQDYVDIRLFLPNGEDYVVLSKKCIRFDLLSEEQDNCYFWMDEAEILNFSSALVDAYLYPGALLYTVKYIDPLLQEESSVSYVPSLATMTLMKEHPEILSEAEASLTEEKRKNLEDRLADSINRDVAEIQWNGIKGEQKYQVKEDESNNQDIYTDIQELEP